MLYKCNDCERILSEREIIYDFGEDMYLCPYCDDGNVIVLDCNEGADIDDMRYNPLKENLTKLLELSEQVLTVAYDNEDNHLEHLAHELKTTIEYMMEDFDL